MNREEVAEYTGLIALSVGLFVAMVILSIVISSVALGVFSFIPFYLYLHTIRKALEKVKE